MKSVSLTDADRNDKLDQLGADLVSCVYQVILRETTPHNWLELELGLWKAIGNRLETEYTDRQRAFARIPFKQESSDDHY